MFFGKKHFNEFKEDKPKLSNKVLSNCLKELEEKGLIKKIVLNTTPVTTEYCLTEYGKSMNRIVYELAMFTLYDENDNSLVIYISINNKNILFMGDSSKEVEYRYKNANNYSDMQEAFKVINKISH